MIEEPIRKNILEEEKGGKVTNERIGREEDILQEAKRNRDRWRWSKTDNKRGEEEKMGIVSNEIMGGGERGNNEKGEEEKREIGRKERIVGEMKGYNEEREMGGREREHWGKRAWRG